MSYDNLRTKSFIFFETETPVGKLYGKTDEKSLHSLSFNPQVENNTLSSTPLTLMITKQIEMYFLGKLKNFDLPTSSFGTTFQNNNLGRASKRNAIK